MKEVISSQYAALINFAPGDIVSDDPEDMFVILSKKILVDHRSPQRDDGTLDSLIFDEQITGVEVVMMNCSTGVLRKVRADKRVREWMWPAWSTFQLLVKTKDVP